MSAHAEIRPTCLSEGKEQSFEARSCIVHLAFGLGCETLSHPRRHDFEACSIQCLCSRRNLSRHLFALPTLFKHPENARKLSLDAAETLCDVLTVRFLDLHANSLGTPSGIPRTPANGAPGSV